MWAARETGQRNRSGRGRFRAPCATVQPPFVMRIAGAIRKASRWDAAPSTIHANAKRRRSIADCAHGFAGYRSAQRDHAALIAAVGAGANAGRAGLQAEPIPEDLRLSP